jgi:hypothetical protein
MHPSHSEGMHVIPSEARDPELDAPRTSPGSLVAEPALSNAEGLLGMTC